MAYEHSEDDDVNSSSKSAKYASDDSSLVASDGDDDDPATARLEHAVDGCEEDASEEESVLKDKAQVNKHPGKYPKDLYLRLLVCPENEITRLDGNVPVGGLRAGQPRPWPRERPTDYVVQN